MFCKLCGAANMPGTSVCKDCGTARVSGAEAPHQLDSPGESRTVPPESGGTSSLEGQRELYAMAIGPKNQERYLRKFAEFEGAGTQAGWHWPAFFATFYWLLYRKMWGRAVFYFFAPPIAFTIANAVLAAVSPIAAAPFALAYLVGIFVVPAMYADAWYYRRCQKIIAEAKTVNDKVNNQLIQVARSGQTSGLVAVTVALVGPIFIVGILAAVSLPAYQDYTVRTKTVEAMTHVQSATLAVGNFYERKQALPRNLREAGFDLPNSKYVQDLQLSPVQGVLTLVLAGPSAIAGKTIEFVPVADPSGKVTWKCQPGTVAERYLPPDCRTRQASK